MLTDLKAKVVEGIVDQLCTIEAKAIASHVKDVILDVAGKVRNATASGVTMTDDEVEAYVVTALAAKLKVDEQDILDKAEGIAASKPDPNPPNAKE